MSLRSVSAKILLFIIMMGVIRAEAQDPIEQVSVEHINNSLYRIRYRISASETREVAQVEIKMLRRRSGGLDTEVFSGVIRRSALKPGQTYSYDWRPSTTGELAIRPGDQLQARVFVTMVPAAVVRNSGNQVPKASAGAFQDVQLPLRVPVVLDGSASLDTDGKIVKARWVQLAGPAENIILTPDSLRTLLKEDLPDGKYAFELTVTDDGGAESKDRVVVTVRAPLVQPAPVKPAAPVTSAPRQPVTLQKPLRAGPENAVYELLLPGLGHYKVSGDAYGAHRNPAVFAVSAAYLGAIGGGFYFRSKSNGDYNKYTELANFREYQKDAAGNIIGVRGGNEEEAQQYLDASKSARRKAITMFGVAGGIMAADLVFTLVKGMQHKREWNEARKAYLGLHISGDMQGVAIGLRLKW